MKREMYSGARGDKLMKCSKAVFRTFWKVLSLLKATDIILHSHRKNLVHTLHVLSPISSEIAG